MNTVYIKPDSDGRILDVTSDAFLPDPAGWRAVDRGSGDRFRHAQGNYLPEDLRLMGICRWMTAPETQEREAFVLYEHEGACYGIYRRTESEMEADRAGETQPAGLGERVARLEAQTGEMEQMLDMLLTGVTTDE